MGKLFNRLRLAFSKSTGAVRRNCSYCGGVNVEIYERDWIKLPYQLPDSVLCFEDQMHRRDNGRCASCGLEQSFYVFSEVARKKFYDLGLDDLGANSGYKRYPPSEDFRAEVFEVHYAQRVNTWPGFFSSHGDWPPGKILVLRPYYGEVLKVLKEDTGADIWAIDMSTNCSRFIRENMPDVSIPHGGIGGKIEIEFPSGSDKFDLIVCFHTLVHSMFFLDDLETLRNLLMPGGAVIFCDEITKKFHNPFHFVHLDEAIFTKILDRHFLRTGRIDNCGEAHRHIAPYTLKGDNPDIVAWA